MRVCLRIGCGFPIGFPSSIPPPPSKKEEGIPEPGHRPRAPVVDRSTIEIGERRSYYAFRDAVREITGFQAAWGTNDVTQGTPNQLERSSILHTQMAVNYRTRFEVVFFEATLVGFQKKSLYETNPLLLCSIHKGEAS